MRDTSLNSTGVRQAYEAGEKLKEYAPKALYASDLTRTMQRQSIIGEIGLSPKGEPRLREIHFGEWEGRTYPEVFKLYPEEVRIWRESPMEAQVPGGEALKEVLARMLEAIEDFCSQSNGNVVVVTHGGPIRLFLYHIGAKGAMWEYPVNPGSVIVIDNSGGSGHCWVRNKHIG